jgi:hypothetical protein
MRSACKVLKAWRQLTPFRDEGDWIFASPVKHGKLPICYTFVWEQFARASREAGILTLEPTRCGTMPNTGICRMLQPSGQDTPICRFLIRHRL